MQFAQRGLLRLEAHIKVFNSACRMWIMMPDCAGATFVSPALFQAQPRISKHSTFPSTAMDVQTKHLSKHSHGFPSTTLLQAQPWISNVGPKHTNMSGTFACAPSTPNFTQPDLKKNKLGLVAVDFACTAEQGVNGEGGEAAGQEYAPNQVPAELMDTDAARLGVNLVRGRGGQDRRTHLAKCAELMDT
eukprot:scaffold302330_cov14-Tisochrysis_lutea.AAC.1